MGWYDVREGNPVKKALASGEQVVGTFIRVPAPELAQVSAHAGCDFVIVDTEHTPVGWERIASVIVAAENAGTVALLRVSNPGRDLISRGLDAGAHGIMVPQVEDPVTAASVVAATRYGPDGARGTAGNVRSGFGLKMGYADYVPASNEAMLAMVQIESRAAVEAIDEIAAVAGIDCLFFGLADLSVDLGFPGDFSHPEVQSHVDRVLAAAEQAGVPTGVPVSDAEMAKTYVDRGVQMIATSDVGVFAAGISSFVDEVRG